VVPTGRSTSGSRIIDLIPSPGVVPAHPQRRRSFDFLVWIATARIGVRNGESYLYPVSSDGQHLEHVARLRGGGGEHGERNAPAVRALEQLDLLRLLGNKDAWKSSTPKSRPRSTVSLINHSSVRVTRWVRAGREGKGPADRLRSKAALQYDSSRAVSSDLMGRATGHTPGR
jgi:hypothetical protein